MTTIDATVMQQALEALESLFSGEVDESRGIKCSDATDALRAALSQPTSPVQEEPVAWLVYAGIMDMRPVYPACKTRELAEQAASEIKSVTKVRPLYTHPALTAALSKAVRPVTTPPMLLSDGTENPEWFAFKHSLQTAPVAQPVQPAEEQEFETSDEVGNLVYRGNSVSYIYQKMQAYSKGISEAWKAMADIGASADGKTDLPTAIRRLAATSAKPVAWMTVGYMGEPVIQRHPPQYAMQVTPLYKHPAIAQPKQPAMPEFDCWQMSNHTMYKCDVGEWVLYSDVAAAWSKAIAQPAQEGDAKDALTNWKTWDSRHDNEDYQPFLAWWLDYSAAKIIHVDDDGKTYRHNDGSDALKHREPSHWAEITEPNAIAAIASQKATQ